MSLFGSNEITGIDIGAGSIKVVRITRSGRCPKLLSAGIVEFPLSGENSAVSADLRHLVAKKKIGRGTIVTQMPGKDLTIRSLTLPRMPQAELAEAVRWEAKRHISFPLDAALIEYLIVGEKQEGAVDKYDIVLVAAERSKVAEHLVPLTEANINVTAVDANALALRNVFHLLEKPTDVNTAVVDIGSGKTEIDIFKGGILKFSRCLETGGLDMTSAIAVAQGIGLHEAEEIKQSLNVLTTSEEDPATAAVKTKLNGLIMEIRRSVEYYKTTFREKSVEGTILTGGVSLMQGIREYVSESLEGVVELDQPLSGVSSRKEILAEFEPIAPRFSVAIGLALRKL